MKYWPSTGWLVPDTGVCCWSTVGFTGIRCGIQFAKTGENQNYLKFRKGVSITISMSIIWDVLVGYFKGSKLSGQAQGREGQPAVCPTIDPQWDPPEDPLLGWWWVPLCSLLHLTKPYQTYLCLSCEVLLSRKTKENLFVRPHGYLVHLNWRHTTQTAENKDNWGQQLKADWHIWVCLWAPWTKPYRKMLFAVIKVFPLLFFPSSVSKL